METIQFIQSTPQQLTDQISEAVKTQLQQLKKEILNKDADDELMTRKEACKLLNIEQTTLWHWTNKGRVTAYGIANRRYYKRSELMKALKPLNK